MKTKQFNTPLPEGLTIRVKRDAVSIGVRLSDYAEKAFELFLAKSIEQRRGHLAGRKKLLGRKISV